MPIELGTCTHVIVHNDDIIQIKNRPDDEAVWKHTTIIDENTIHYNYYKYHSQVPPYHGFNGSVMDWINK